jgi:hypothetical protein
VSAAGCQIHNLPDESTAPKDSRELAMLAWSKNQLHLLINASTTPAQAASKQGSHPSILIKVPNVRGRYTQKTYSMVLVPLAPHHNSNVTLRHCIRAKGARTATMLTWRCHVGCSPHKNACSMQHWGMYALPLWAAICHVMRHKFPRIAARFKPFAHRLQHYAQAASPAVINACATVLNHTVPMQLQFTAITVTTIQHNAYTVTTHIKIGMLDMPRTPTAGKVAPL